MGRIQQLGLAMLVMLVIVTTASLHFFTNGFRFGGRTSDACLGVAGAGLEGLESSVGIIQLKVGKAMEALQAKISDNNADMTRSERVEESNLLLDVAIVLDQVKVLISQLQKVSSSSSSSSSFSTFSDIGCSNDELGEEGKVVVVEEMGKYMQVKDHRLGKGKKNFMGANGSYAAVGYACMVSASEEMRKQMQEYMQYDVGDYCKDDWTLGQKLMIHGCDPLPRRRCLARAPQLYDKPLPLNKNSLWTIPDDRNVRWNNYKCHNFSCVASVHLNSSSKGFHKCGECFNLEGNEKYRWISNKSSVATGADFLLADVMAVKAAGEIRIGLDFSVGVGTFAARMKEEYDATIISATLNLGAPFNEMIALRGLVPLYLTVNQRLPFFDNTLDLIHTTLFFDGWVDHIFLDFVLFDWDRVLRPGGLLWIDRFFCNKEHLEDYLYFFLQLHYKKHMWVVTPKLDKAANSKEVYFSAVLEKPPRPF